MKKIKTLMTVLCAALLVMGMATSASALPYYFYKITNNGKNARHICPLMFLILVSKLDLCLPMQGRSCLRSQIFTLMTVRSWAFIPS